MLVEFDRFKNEELVDKSIKKQELADTEKKLLVLCEIIRIYYMINCVGTED